MESQLIKNNPPPKLSIIIPTLKEAINILILVSEITITLESVLPGWEVIIVDDNSRDGTIKICDRLSQEGAPLELIVRKNRRGLGTAVLDGFVHAKAPVFVVMDGDLSHPPASIPLFYKAIKDGAEFVLGSRYIPGGSTDDRWTVYRFINSKFASLLARGLISASDPMSGFFALSRSLWERCDNLSPFGYKIGLELIVKGRPRIVKEIPIHFRTRMLGKSKLSFRQQLLYLYHLRLLYRYKFSSATRRPRS